MRKLKIDLMSYVTNLYPNPDSDFLYFPEIRQLEPLTRRAYDFIRDTDEDLIGKDIVSHLRDKGFTVKKETASSGPGLPPKRLRRRW